MTIERTLVLIKPDAVSRGLTGEILNRYERKGLKVVALKQLMATPELADKHYAEHVEKPFYPGLKEFICSAPLVAIVLEGDSAIECVRTLNGKTDGRKADAGSIRGDYSTSNQLNLVHGSDSPESAEREIAIWFGELN